MRSWDAVILLSASSHMVPLAPAKHWINYVVAAFLYHWVNGAVVMRGVWHWGGGGSVGLACLDCFGMGMAVMGGVHGSNSVLDQVEHYCVCLQCRCSWVYSNSSLSPSPYLIL